MDRVSRHVVLTDEGGGSVDEGEEDDDNTVALSSEATVVAPNPRASTTPPLMQPPNDPRDPYIGRVMSERYRVLSKLGEGGMGTVYLAEHIVIEKKVAIKVLSEDFARKADLVARFMQEAKAASRIGHENIVDITDFGQTDAGSVFIAMEYLEGADLATVIREQGPLPFARARDITIQLCRGLGAAHGKGIIHRDMKPENIFLVERDGRADFVKILDFGIAKMSANDESNERLTRTGMIFGTPEYMSPEQARGDRPDHRVDIYAVGCIIYEMLTGDVPFHAETFMGVLTKHMFESPDPPSNRAPDANILPDIEAVVMRALTKNRDERFQTMRELALAVAACDGGDLDGVWGQEGSGQYRPIGQPSRGVSRVVPGPISTAPSLEVGLRPRRSWAWSVLPVLAAVGAGLFIWQWQTPVIPPIVAALPITPEPVGAPPPEPVPPVVPLPATEHSIRVESNIAGPGGELFRGAERLGTLPGEFSLKHSEREVRLTAMHKGYKTLVIEVLPDRDRQYMARFEPLSVRKGPAQTGRPSPPNPTVHPEPSRPEPVKVEPDPVKKRDLMDPWQKKL